MTRLPCPACEGTGTAPNAGHPCDLCGGGKTLTPYEYHDFIATYSAPRAPLATCLICAAPITGQSICQGCEESGQRLDGQGRRSAQELAREVR